MVAALRYLSAESTDIASTFLQTGVIGATALLFLGIAWELYKRETRNHESTQARVKELETEVRQLNEELRHQIETASEKYLPAAQQATAAIEQLLKVAEARKDNR